jgi:hypothetical protein
MTPNVSGVLLRPSRNLGMKDPDPTPSESDEDLAQILAGTGPCTYLLLSLLALILLFPYVEQGVIGRIVTGILFSAVLLLGSLAVPQSRRTLALKIALALVAVALQWAALSTRIAPILDLAAIAYLASLAVAIASVLGYVLKHGRITADKLHGALAGYIMLAILYAFIYALLERATADSFGPAHLEFLEPGTFFHMIYFSLTTLTTTGYGDIVPLTNQAARWSWSRSSPASFTSVS